MTDRLTNKVAVVTGAARGIGREIALTLAEEGAKTVLLDLSDQVFRAENELLNKGFHVSAFRADVSNFKEVFSIAKHVIRKFRKIDILVNNAGIVLPFSLEKFSEEDLEKVMAVNLEGVFNCCMAFVPFMIKHRYGRIVNISSIAGILVGTRSIYYSASKAAIIGLTRSLALWVADYGITVNAVCPGVVETELTKTSLGEDRLRELATKVPLKRLASPKDIANLVLFLVSDEASYITGQYIIIDGGLTITSPIW